MEETETQGEDLSRTQELWTKTLGARDLDSLDLAATFRDGYVPPVRPRTALEQRPTPIALIARGGNGEVFRARQEVLEREVALKQLKPQLAAGNDSREAFLAEAVVNGRLEHPNIVPVYSLGENADAELFLAMKLVEGSTWKDLLRGEKKGDLLFHLDVLLQVCNAIAYAHSRSIVHNDLKPGNVMLGAFGEVLVLDWGLAVDFQQRPDPHSRVRHKSTITIPCGTPCYMAPELALGNGAEIGPWTDVYLLGAILYEILTGSAPHRGRSLFDVVARVVSGAPVEFPEPGPPELQDICLDAMRLRPSGRPTVLELQERVRSYLRHRESHTITAAAQRELDVCLRGDDPLESAARTLLYERYAEVVAGFRQARRLWEANARARSGEAEARRAFARAALRHGDIGLAEAQLAHLADDATLTAEVHDARTAQRAERRARQRLRRGLGAAIAALVIGLACGLSVVLWQNAELADEKLRVESRNATIEAQNLALATEKERVEEQRRYASARGDIASDALDDLMQGVQQRLVRGVGSGQAVGVARDLLATALHGWERLLETDTAHGVASFGRARAEINVGLLKFELDGALIGSEEHLARGQAALEDLPRRDIEWWEVYTLAQRGRARVAFHQGRLRDAIARHDTCVVALRDLLAETPDDLRLVQALSASLRRLSALHVDRGALGLARSTAEEALRIERSRLAATPADPLAPSMLAHALGQVAQVAARDGDLVRAEECLREALAVRRAQSARLPDSAMLRGDLASVLGDLGNVLLDREQHVEARALLEESIGLWRGLCVTDSTNATWRKNLASCLRLLAEWEDRSGQPAAAEVLFAECVALRVELLSRDPSSVTARRELAVDISNQARNLASLDEVDRARALLGDAIAIFRELVAQVPESSDRRRDLGITLQQRGRLDAARRAPEAVDALVEAEEILIGLLAETPESYDLLRSLAVGTNSLAEVLWTLGARDEALRRGALSLNHWRALLALEANNEQALPDAAHSYARQAQRLLTAGEVDAGFARFAEALELSTTFVAEDPEQPARLRSLLGFLGEVAQASMVHGRYDQAYTHQAQAVELWRALAAGADAPLSTTAELAAALRERGLAEQALGQAEEAERSLAESIALLETCRAAEPGDRSYAVQLAMTAFSLGMLQESRGAFAEAFASLDRAVESHLRIAQPDADIRAQLSGLQRERDRLRMLLDSGDLLSGERLPATPEEHLLLASQRWSEGRPVDAYPLFAVALATLEPVDDGLWAQAAECAVAAIEELEGEASERARADALAWLGRWIEALRRMRDAARTAVFQRGDVNAQEELEQLEAMLAYFQREHPAYEALRGSPDFEELFGD